LKTLPYIHNFIISVGIEYGAPFYSLEGKGFSSRTSMKGLGTLGKRVVGASAGGAGVIAAQQPAHARAPPPAQPAPVQAPVQAGNSKLDDGWLLTDFNEDKLLFKPFSAAEVEEAVEQVGLAGGRQGPAPHACVIEELDEEGPTSPPTGASSEGSQADCVIESTHISPQQQQMADLLKISNKLLQRPGLQREIVAVMYEDVEVCVVVSVCVSVHVCVCTCCRTVKVLQGCPRH